MNGKKRGPSAAEIDQADIDNERMGRNSLQGEDQQQVRNERQTVPDERRKADGVIESFRKLDKDVRARTDLNKGATRDPRK